jgi:glycosyltransferase involved in cell wall biosynthesis
VKQSVVVISAISPLPVDNGRRVFLAGLVQYLCDRLGPDDVHYGLVASPDVPTPALPCRVHRLPMPTPAEQLGNALVQSIVRRRLSLQEAMLSSRRLSTAVADLIAVWQPSLEFYDTARMAQHRVPFRLNTRSIVHLDDLYSVRYARMVETSDALGADFDPLGEFASNIPGFLRRLASVPAVYRPLLRWESRRMRQRETAIARESPCTLLVNAGEVANLSHQAGVSTVRVITPLAPIPRATLRAPAKPAEFVFLGRLNVPHNNDAICSFIRDALPVLLQRSPGCQLRIIGNGALATLRHLAGKYPNAVVLQGFVEDLDTIFARATAVIAPLRFGSGVKQKVLDALARGVPVIGTEVTFEGIPVSRGSSIPSLSAAAGSDGCIVADDVRAWPEILASLADEATNIAYSAAAADFFRRTYSREVVYAQYDDIFQLHHAPVGEPR